MTFLLVRLALLLVVLQRNRNLIHASIVMTFLLVLLALLLVVLQRNRNLIPASRTPHAPSLNPSSQHPPRLLLNPPRCTRMTRRPFVTGLGWLRCWMRRMSGGDGDGLLGWMCWRCWGRRLRQSWRQLGIEVVVWVVFSPFFCWEDGGEGLLRPFLFFFFF
ncbi:hypothetical protein BC829DRAFT_394027 [Chytridium lagenaria]|nr:hypothetical protein BC829DRAFT_394027 [Chytridium lagenaria]